MKNEEIIIGMLGRMESEMKGLKSEMKDVETRLTAKIDHNFKVLNDKIDVLNAKVDTNFAVTNDKIDVLAENTKVRFQSIEKS